MQRTKNSMAQHPFHPPIFLRDWAVHVVRHSFFIADPGGICGQGVLHIPARSVGSCFTGLSEFRDLLIEYIGLL